MKQMHQETLYSILQYQFYTPTGVNITAAVVDDGLEWNNPDLLVNYDAGASWDLNDKDLDPSPSTKSGNNLHFE